MIEDTLSKAGKAFWVIALIGFLLPWIVIIFCQIYFGQAAEIRHFPAHLFESGYNFFLVAVMNATPFAIVAVSARFLLKAGAGTTDPAQPFSWSGRGSRFRHGLEFICSDRRLEQRLQP